MGIIRKLDAQTANSIAAGEVVERPASVVKELCENALDAGATHIHIDLKNGGMQAIHVVDNGCGMDAEDVKMAFVAHATSKLSQIDDLNHLSTMGFRGEALASIAAVSKITVKTKQADSAWGTFLRIEGGEVLDHQSCGCSNGTSILVEHLFYNTPARYKFLKKDTTEASKITDIVQRFVLARPDVSFQLTHHGQTIIHSPGNHDLQSAIYSLFYQKGLTDLLSIQDVASHTIGLTGYISGTQGMKKSRQWQFFFVNNRMIKSPLMTKALEDGYQSFAMKGQFPVCVLKLLIPPSEVDINVHPQKTEVRFANEQAIYHTIKAAVKATLLEHVGPKNIDFDVVAKASKANMNVTLAEPQPIPWSFLPAQQNAPSNPSPALPERQHLPQESAAMLNPVKPTSNAENLIKHWDTPTKAEDKQSPPAVATTNSDAQVTTSKNAMRPLQEGRFLGALFNTYLIIEGKEVCYLVDQHAAHEKINFYRFKAEFANHQTVSQP